MYTSSAEDATLLPAFGSKAFRDAAPKLTKAPDVRELILI